MTEDSGGGGPSWAFGSRYNGLDIDQQELEWSVKGNNRANNGKKRSANRAAHNEIQFTKLMKVDSYNGPRFLVLNRTDKDETMKTVSPFFIRKAMDIITPNVTIVRTRDGGLLLKTIDRQQAEKLKKQKILGGTINIEITEHPTLNSSRGTIFCPDLKMHTDEEIVDELRSQHVTAVQRVKRRNRKGDFEDSGVFILTFNLGNIPNSIDAGFHCCKIKQYIPPPLRCMNCLKFGHKRTVCKGNQICASCANLYHDKTQCQQSLKCVVCRGDHHALSKDCPVYQDELEIQRMKITEKITYREARQKRRQQAPDPNPPRLRQSFSSLFKTPHNAVGQQKNIVTSNQSNDHDIETEGNSSNYEPTLQRPASSRTTSTTQMNSTMTTPTQPNKEPQSQNEYSISLTKGSTNTKTNTPEETEINHANSNTTNTQAESNNLSILSQFITQSIHIDDEQFHDNTL
ncbi:uncharacterized protein LOC109426503 [Aedes albopictus]|uniref:CCHC-type domain-containing protein n=1 Tax=Aedes albopictus TaxID=7160 RepID=A0ABM1XW93_AEDAL|nr:uncharacterized protein LOC109407350 [Aedes albopictus]XP_029715099.1 uncharacterized protein LOC109426503 [Aedes albopictus]XP_029731773.1 uncharacterized protein LOC115268020 [Aedes albopictus]